jgi:hypothetical protein
MGGPSRAPSPRKSRRLLFAGGGDFVTCAQTDLAAVTAGNFAYTGAD